MRGKRWVSLILCGFIAGVLFSYSTRSLSGIREKDTPKEKPSSSCDARTNRPNHEISVHNAPGHGPHPTARVAVRLEPTNGVEPLTC